MDKLLDPNEVKRYYRKATMLCHPDKLRNCEDQPDKVYIANRCFAALTEAYKIYQVRSTKSFLSFIRKKKGFSESRWGQIACIRFDICTLRHKDYSSIILLLKCDKYKFVLLIRV